jgi:hypothetical protein
MPTRPARLAVAAPTGGLGSRATPRSRPTPARTPGPPGRRSWAPRRSKGGNITEKVDDVLPKQVIYLDASIEGGGTSGTTPTSPRGPPPRRRGPLAGHPRVEPDHVLRGNGMADEFPGMPGRRVRPARVRHRVRPRRGNGTGRRAAIEIIREDPDLAPCEAVPDPPGGGRNTAPSGPASPPGPAAGDRPPGPPGGRLPRGGRGPGAAPRGRRRGESFLAAYADGFLGWIGGIEGVAVNHPPRIGWLTAGPSSRRRSTGSSAGTPSRPAGRTSRAGIPLTARPPWGSPHVEPRLTNLI